MPTVRDLMTEDVTTVHRDATLDQVHDLMLSLGVRHVPVVDDDDELAGLISNRDIVGLLGKLRSEAFEEQIEALATTTAAEAMTRGLATIEPDAAIEAAAQLMLENKIGSLPVCEGRHLVGILTEADFVRFVAGAAEAEG